MPAFDVPVRITMSSSYTRLRGKHLAEPVPPEPHRLMTNVDATLGQQILNWRSVKGYRTYIITVGRITSGELLK